MPWSNQAVTLIVLFEEMTGFSGLFAYSPAPGTGTLVASIAAAPGRDPYGNPYQEGITAYNSPAIFAQLLGGELVLRDNVGHVWEVFADTARSTLDIQGPGDTLFVSTAGLLVSGVTGVPETWHPMALTGNWAAGTQPPEYQLMPVGSTGQVHLRGSIKATANNGTATIFFTLPAGYAPSTAQEWITASTLASPGGGTVEVDTSGNLSNGTAITTGEIIRLDGIIIQL